MPSWSVVEKEIGARGEGGKVAEAVELRIIRCWGMFVSQCITTRWPHQAQLREDMQYA